LLLRPVRKERKSIFSGGKKIPAEENAFVESWEISFEVERFSLGVERFLRDLTISWRDGSLKGRDVVFGVEEKDFLGSNVYLVAGLRHLP